MENTKISILPFLMEIFLIIFGIFYFILNRLGYIFVPTNVILFYILSAIIIIYFTILTLKYKNIQTKISIILSAITPILAVIYLILKFISSSNEGINLNIFIIYAYITLICNMVIFFLYAHRKIIKIGLGILYSILTVLSFLILLVFLFFGNFSVDKIVNSENSPNSKYFVEIIEKDQGALGGNTYVRVWMQSKNINVFVGTIKKVPKYIYRGRYGELYSATLRWETDEILYMDNIKYIINEINDYKSVP